MAISPHFAGGRVANTYVSSLLLILTMARQATYSAPWKFPPTLVVLHIVPNWQEVTVLNVASKQLDGLHLRPLTVGEELTV